MMITPVDKANIMQAAAIHAISWQASHRAFCAPDFVEKHTPERQLEYLQSKMKNGSKVYMLVDEKPVGIVSVTGSLIEDLYVLPDIINRHGDFYPEEIKRLLKPGGMFITQQVGSDNDRELVKMVLPEAEKPFPHYNLLEQKAGFVDAGFEILLADEVFTPICFYDVGAFVWFARIIEWEFPGFSVDGCFDRLLELQKTIERDGKITGTTHRYLIVARKDR